MEVNFTVKVSRMTVLMQIILVVVIILLYILKGFDNEEISELVPILAPVTFLFVGIAIKNISTHLKDKEIENPLPPPHARMIQALIYTHYSLIITLLALKAFAPNILSFHEMLICLSIVESYFGIHMGTLISEFLGNY